MWIRRSPKVSYFVLMYTDSLIIRHFYDLFKDNVHTTKNVYFWVCALKSFVHKIIMYSHNPQKFVIKLSELDNCSVIGWFETNHSVTDLSSLYTAGFDWSFKLQYLLNRGRLFTCLNCVVWFQRRGGCTIFRWEPQLNISMFCQFFPRGRPQRSMPQTWQFKAKNIRTLLRPFLSWQPAIFGRMGVLIDLIPTLCFLK